MSTQLGRLQRYQGTSSLVPNADLWFQVLLELCCGRVCKAWKVGTQHILFARRWAGHDFPIMVVLAVFGSFISYIYSAPPLKLKQEGWTGNYALGSSYIALPWWAGQAQFGTLSLNVMVLTVLYSLAGLGIAIVNDFKSIEGDRAMGLQSLPVAFGIDTAKYICAATIDVTQLSVAAYLYAGLHKPIYAAVLLGLTLPQVRLIPVRCASLHCTTDAEGSTAV